jgi:uncharacterized membrane protein
MQYMSRELQAQARPVFKALIILSLVSVLFFAIGAWRNHSLLYWYLIWNLFLAWVPLILAYFLINYLATKKWLSTYGVILTALLIGFLPNSFYMVSDLIHLVIDSNAGRVNPLFDSIMFFSFAFTGIVLGFISLYLVHRELLKRFITNYAHLIIAVILLLVGFAIYLGRDLQLNTWDVIINPAGVLFAVSDRIINIQAHPAVISTTFGFFLLFGSQYLVFWIILQSLKVKRSS